MNAPYKVLFTGLEVMDVRGAAELAPVEPATDRSENDADTGKEQRALHFFGHVLMPNGA